MEVRQEWEGGSRAGDGSRGGGRRGREWADSRSRCSWNGAAPGIRRMQF
jgi:hypothetical protein